MKRYFKNIINYFKRPEREKGDKILYEIEEREKEDKILYEIDINNPVKSIYEIYNDIKLKKEEYPRRVGLTSLNGEIRVRFSEKPKSLKELLESFGIKYIVSKDSIEESKLCEIMRKYGTNRDATSINTRFYTQDRDLIPDFDKGAYQIEVETSYGPHKLTVIDIDPSLPSAYLIKREKVPSEDKLIIEALSYIERNKKLYNSLRDTLKKFRIDETKIEEIIADIKNKERTEINLSEEVPIEEVANIYLEGAKKGFVPKLSNSWKTSENSGGRVELELNYHKDSHIIDIWMYPPTEEKIKQLLTDMENIGMEIKELEIEELSLY